MNLHEKVDQALRSAEPFARLRELVLELSAGGRSSSEVLELFEAERVRLREQGRAADEDIVMDVMDCLSGWCAPSARLTQ